MKLTARHILSATTALGLVAFTLVSAFTAGVNGPGAVIGLALLAIYGLLEIAVLSYAPSRFEYRPRAAVPAPTPGVVDHRVSAIVEMPADVGERRAA